MAYNHVLFCGYSITFPYAPGAIWMWNVNIGEKFICARVFPQSEYMAWIGHKTVPNSLRNGNWYMYSTIYVKHFVNFLYEIRSGWSSKCQTFTAWCIRIVMQWLECNNDAKASSNVFILVASILHSLSRSMEGTEFHWMDAKRIFDESLISSGYHKFPLQEFSKQANNE